MYVLLCSGRASSMENSPAENADIVRRAIWQSSCMHDTPAPVLRAPVTRRGRDRQTDRPPGEACPRAPGSDGGHTSPPQLSYGFECSLCVRTPGVRTRSAKLGRPDLLQPAWAEKIVRGTQVARTCVFWCPPITDNTGVPRRARADICPAKPGDQIYRNKNI